MSEELAAQVERTLWILYIWGSFFEEDDDDNDDKVLYHTHAHTFEAWI